jgi:hypothetical protein
MRTAATGTGSRAGSAASFERLPGVAQLDLRGYAARDSDSAHAFSGHPAEDKRGLISPLPRCLPVAQVNATRRNSICSCGKHEWADQSGHVYPRAQRPIQREQCPSPERQSREGRVAQRRALGPGMWPVCPFMLATVRNQVQLHSYFGRRAKA